MFLTACMLNKRKQLLFSLLVFGPDLETALKQVMHMVSILAVLIVLPTSQYHNEYPCAKSATYTRNPETIVAFYYPIFLFVRYNL